MRHAKALWRRYGPVELGLLAAGLVLFAGTFAAYLGGDALARYAWRQWQEPALAITLDRHDAPLLMEIGSNYFGATIIGRAVQRYNPALAARAYRKALAIEPGTLWGHYQLARIAFAKGDFATALTEVNAELAANPENLRALYVRGLIYGYRNLPGDLALAEADLDRFTRWAPTEWAGYNDLAWILNKEGKYADAEAVITRAFANVPQGAQNPWLLNELGVARLNAGDAAGAHAAFASALNYALEVTPGEWRAAYTGDSPAEDAGGRAAFIASISANLAKAGG